jgi:FkbM family methyltransferase
LERGWSGILIEPVPSFYASILSKNRNIFSINACIASNKPIVAKLRVGDSLTGRLKEMKASELSRMEKYYGKNNLSTLYVPCFSLNTILSAIGINKVDYFSLDVEGGELDVIKSIKHDKITIDIFTIEHNYFQDRKSNIISHLEGKGFKKLAEVSHDVYFQRRVLFNKTS